MNVLFENPPSMKSRYSLSVNQDFELIYSMAPRPNPNWRYVDKAGHEHYYDEKSGQYPTLQLIIDEARECDCEFCWHEDEPYEYIVASHYECPLCKEVVVPSETTLPFQIPGPRTGTLRGIKDGVRLTVEIPEDLLDELYQQRYASNDHVDVLFDRFVDEHPELITSREYGPGI